jgi:hypothetical protein
MPYASNGVYTPPTGAENAAPGQVIRSATWNSIFTDLSTALTQVGQRTWLQSPRSITTNGTFTVLTTDNAVFVSAFVGTILMPAASLMAGPVRILGAASTVFGSGTVLVMSTITDKFDNQGTITLATNYQVASFYPIPTIIGGGYVVVYA